MPTGRELVVFERNISNNSRYDVLMPTDSSLLISFSARSVFWGSLEFILEREIANWSLFRENNEDKKEEGLIKLVLADICR